MDPVIEKSRNIAIDQLKPSKAELEHGLELHADSIVCDAYGFSPRAAMDGARIAFLLEEGASDGEIRDATEEMIMTRFVHDETERREFVDAWTASGVTCMFQMAGEEVQYPLQTLKRLARYQYVCDNMKGFLRKATSPMDIINAKKEGLRCLCLTCNAVPMAQKWVSVAEELGLLRVFFQLGARMMHLTYNRRNVLGDGCGESSDAGLSDFGREAIAEMNRVGIMVDVAHSGWRTAREAAEVSHKPVVASHSGACAVNRHIRCKPDDTIRAIVDSGGYIGICGVPMFLGGAGTITSLLDHVDHVASTFGVDHVAIGTDRAHHSRYIKAERAKIPKRRSTRRNFQSLWPEGSSPYVSGWNDESQLLSLSWTNWPLFTVGLVQRGYSDEDIRKIIGGNVLRVAEECLA